MSRAENRKFKDYYPNLKKEDSLPIEIFRVLKITPEETDFAKGSTFTKQGMGKILKQLEIMNQEYPEIFDSLISFEERGNL